jgi:hypothetical protein
LSAVGSISLCMTASRDPAALRALLTLLRPAVDEIVLGVDSRAADQTFATCGDLVDQAYVYEFETTVEQYVPWLYHRCTGDWVLRLDDDEVPGTGLLAMLPELAADRRRSSFAMPVRNLFPTRDSFIASHPWYPEYRTRMVRNVSGLWTCSNGPHSVVEATGERRVVPDAPVYHLHYVAASVASRLATGHVRERDQPGLLTEAYPVNALPTPELWTSVATAPVPDADRPAIAAVAHPVPVDAMPSSPPEPEPIPPADAARLVVERDVTPHAYEAAVSISPARPTLAAGTIAHLEVRIRNLGTEHWPPSGQDGPLIRPTYRWLAADGVTVIESEGLRTPFTETVRPGEETIVMLAARVPPVPGRYVIEIDVVHELVRWFECPARMEIVVEDLERPPAGGDSRLARPDRARIGL